MEVALDVVLILVVISMKIKTNKIIIIGISLAVIALLVIILLTQNDKKEYLSEPIPQTAIAFSPEKVSIKELAKWVEKNDFYLWEVKNDIKLQKVEQIAYENNLKLIRSEEGVVYHWTKDSAQLIYNLSSNTLTVLGKDIIKIDGLSSVTSATFTDLFKKYFELDFLFEVFMTEKKESGETVYYAKRYLDETNLIEIGSHNYQTDYIAVKNGKILYANLLLAEYQNTNKILPLIARDELEKYINQANYPKDFYPQMSILNNNPVFEKIEYIESEYKKVLSSINNCKADDISIVYIYKKMSQKYLTPVYKLQVQCELEYEGDMYSIPGTMFVNAIQPEFVSTEN